MNTSLRLSLVLLLFILAASACSNTPPVPSADPTGQTPSTAAAGDTPAPQISATPTEVPVRTLTVCLGAEPTSLFPFVDASAAARSVQQALNSGPFSVRGFTLQPVTLEGAPVVSLEPLEVSPGAVIFDAAGSLNNLKDGVSFWPSGCHEAACAQVYAGPAPVIMDQQVIRYTLKTGLRWSDGAALTASDSLYAYEAARSLYPRARAESIVYTQGYQALDSLTNEWRGVPGYSAASASDFFFAPLPSQAWSALTPEDLLTDEGVNRNPPSWGPYMLAGWTSGEEIRLQRNPHYFAAALAQPVFDELLFHFVEPGQPAIDALLAGGCELLDETTLSEADLPALLELQAGGQIQLATAAGSAFEQLAFNLTPADGQPVLVQAAETRQALALCLDRERLAAEIMAGQSHSVSSYTPAAHPLFNPGAAAYAYDPAAGNALLQSAGWQDADNNPATPRTAAGVSGVADGSPLVLTLATLDAPEQLQAAALIQEAWAGCGVGLSIQPMPAEELFAPGPDGLLFGRKFQVAQFAWPATLEPACALYTTVEIPGPFPEHARGWGGANAAGFANAEFDTACRQAQGALPGSPERQANHFQAQAVFARELPVIPLYARVKLAAARPDFCGLQLNPLAGALSNLLGFAYGEGCAP